MSKETGGPAQVTPEQLDAMDRDALLALARDGVRWRERFSESDTGGLQVQERT